MRRMRMTNSGILSLLNVVLMSGLEVYLDGGCFSLLSFRWIMESGSVLGYWEPNMGLEFAQNI